MENPFKRTFTTQEQNMFLFLTRIKIFSDLNYKQMSLFLPYMHDREYVKNEVVFFRDDPSHALYLLKEGEISINLDVDDKFESLAKIKAGVAVGESCLLKDTKRQLNAFVTSDKARFYVIPQDNIFTIFESNLEIKTKMLEALADIYNSYNANLYKAYKSSLGFFNLKQVYM